MRVYFTAEMRQFMAEFVPGHSHKEISEAFQARFGIEFSPRKVKSYITNHGLNTGRTGRFEKGRPSPNKGKPVTPEQYERMSKTMFKPGQKAPNQLPIGTEKVLSDGYIWVKINDIPKAKKQVNWKQKQRLIYEQAHGPIPDGCFVKFLDGNNRNFDLDNLHLVSKGVNGVVNKHNLQFEDKELTKVGIAIAELKIAKKRAKKGCKQ